MEILHLRSLIRSAITHLYADRPAVMQAILRPLGLEYRTVAEGRSYEWPEAIDGLRRRYDLYDLTDIFTRAYSWYHGNYSLCDIAHARIKQDVDEYRIANARRFRHDDGENEYMLPDYVFRMFERTVLRGLV